QGMDVELFHLKAAFQDSHGFDSGLLPLNLVAAPALIDIAGSYSIDVNVEIGYDTFGIREFIGDVIQNPPADLDSLLTPALDLLDGLYVGSNTHLAVTGSLAGGAVALGPFVSAVGGGSVNADLNVATIDSDGDGKRRLFQENIDPCLFSISGGITGEASGLVTMLVFAPFPVIVPYPFDTGFKSMVPASAECIGNPFQPPDTLQLAGPAMNSGQASNAFVVTDPNGTLILNMGSPQRRHDRGLPDEEADINEAFTIAHDDGFLFGDSGESVLVTFHGFTQRFTGVKLIQA